MKDIPTIQFIEKEGDLFDSIALKWFQYGNLYGTWCFVTESLREYDLERLARAFYRGAREINRRRRSRLWEWYYSALDKLIKRDKLGIVHRIR